MRALRLLSPVRTPSGFAVLTLVTLALMWVIVPSGAVVRLTDSGLGCPDWPTCEGTITSVTTGHALIEYTNRILSGIVGVAAVVTWIAAWWAPGAPPGVRRLSLALALCAGAQIPLGAITVASGLHPMAVGSHFLLSMVALATAVLLALAARDWRDGRERRWDPRRGVLAGGVALAAAVVLVTGVVVTAAGPHSGDDDVLRRWGDLALAARVHVRAAMVFTALAVVLVAWVWSARAASTASPRGSCGSPCPWWRSRSGSGEYQYRNGLPWQAVVLHVTVAGLVWAVIAGAAYGVARPAGGGLRPAGGHPLAGDAADRVGQRPEPPLRDLLAAVHADPVGPRVDRRERGLQALLALAPAQLVAQLALALVGVGGGLGGMVVPVAAPSASRARSRCSSAAVTSARSRSSRSRRSCWPLDPLASRGIRRS